MGILSLLGLDLDPITMSVVIIAIGFSVDFTAHICYHFYHYDNPARISNECIDPKIRKLADVYLVIGEPTVQAALSTIISMSPVLFISTESIESFAKTIVVVVLLGTFHGMIIAPAVLSLRSSKKGHNTIMKSGSEDMAVI
uniref:SSD domain-containing protein n=1 Tax=Elaeophora elaphi TaxID=1147741 RepID=A0A0R3RXQ6_9BILA